MEAGAVEMTDVKPGAGASGTRNRFAISLLGTQWIVLTLGPDVPVGRHLIFCRERLHCKQFHSISARMTSTPAATAPLMARVKSVRRNSWRALGIAISPKKKPRNRGPTSHSFSQYKSGPSKAWLKIKNPKAPAATRAADETF